MSSTWNPWRNDRVRARGFRYARRPPEISHRQLHARISTPHFLSQGIERYHGDGRRIYGGHGTRSGHPCIALKERCYRSRGNNFENLVGHCGVPIEDTTSTAQWLAESEELQESDSDYKQALLSPKRCASMATLSQQLLSQNSIGVENFTRGSLLRTVGAALDKGALSGNGNSEPPGHTQ